MWQETPTPEETIGTILEDGERGIDRKLEEFYVFQKALIDQLHQWDDADKQERGQQKEIIHMAAVGKAMPDAAHASALAAHIAPGLTALAQTAESPIFLFAALSLWDDLHRATQAELEEEPEAITQLRDNVEAESLTTAMRKEKEELIDYLAIWYRERKSEGEQLEQLRAA
jgi:hypothetical protein